VKLCIPIEVRPEGGMYTFIGNLKAWLTRRGIAHTSNIDDEYDVLFANSWATPCTLIRRVKRARPDLRVVHRIDGSAVDYGGNPEADRAQARVNLLADVTIFQSAYSRYSTTQKVKVIAADGPIIHNPVDLELFRPEGSRLVLPAVASLRIACVAWSLNRNKGTWLIDQLADAHPECLFVLCGRFAGSSHRPNVIQLGHLGRLELATALRSCDAFVNLSENDPCPNVVLEAMASGLPILFRDSGGVSELAGEAGLAIEAATFRHGLESLIAHRPQLAAAARRRAETHFAPDVIFPQYLAAIDSSSRRPLPSPLAVMKLARAGYPVLPRARTASELVGALQRRSPAMVRRAVRSSSERPRIGWVTYDAFPRRKRRFSQLDSFTGMRAGNVGRWLNANAASLTHELYNPDRRYAVVVFQKMMHRECQAEAEKIRAYGGKVVFDANVNYYEVWGDYFIPGTQPTAEQQRDAQWMTQFADWVVADSSYLQSVIRRITDRVSWIPDNVNLDIYGGERVHAQRTSLQLVWSGIGKKAAHLLLIADVLASLPNLELVLVVDEPPPCLPDLERALSCRVVRFSDRKYASTLQQADVIISPKRLENAYEIGHTEYKITLGMAAGLPAVASPQHSYIEAISYAGGGVIARTEAEWRDALMKLSTDVALRADLGHRARRTVSERYSTPVVASMYGALLEEIAGVAALRAASVSSTS
jgi:glycosyltransferase involved in cell wall biosynthesis